MSVLQIKHNQLNFHMLTLNVFAYVSQVLKVKNVKIILMIAKIMLVKTMPNALIKLVRMSVNVQKDMAAFCVKRNLKNVQLFLANMVNIFFSKKKLFNFNV